MDKSMKPDPARAIAVIGMAGRFPGARSVDELWTNLRDGKESITFFSDEELLWAGVELDKLRDPSYVKANAVLDDVDMFDAEFFGYSPREAELMDPQHRLFLESAWEALEGAGYDADSFQGSIAVYGGSGGMGTYLVNNIGGRDDIMSSAGEHQIFIANDKDFLTTRVSYKLNLSGPSITVQTGCSTSLVAVATACQSLIEQQCDIALAGGVAISFPQVRGYLYRPGMILSPDGHCRAFDAKAEGTVSGSGVGVVVLKRLVDAQNDGDNILALIRGAAINNDGAFKVGYTAPSVEGQAEVIMQALLAADVEPETVTYVEAHGTATPIGDPIEVAALSRAYGASTDRTGFCALGSVKTNLGHLDVAAGVTGLIKVVQSLRHGLIPPSLHFETTNPNIHFKESPFHVNTALSEWKVKRGTTRRAGISSFGIGGTNVHMIVEEAAPAKASGESRPLKLLVLSAKTRPALEAMTASLAAHFARNPELPLADVAYTLQVGRKAFTHRRMLVCRDLAEAQELLSSPDPTRVFTQAESAVARPVAFMFSGQGGQYADMGRELYRTEPAFREQIDLCAELLRGELGFDLRHVLYPSEEHAAHAAERLSQTNVTQPALFAVEYAMAKLWMEWGVHPEAMIGHSLGEYVAACVAGVMSLKDALSLVALRGRLMQSQPSGVMLAVSLPEHEVLPLLDGGVSLAAVNGSSSVVVSGPPDAVARLDERLAERGVEHRRLRISHASHSSMMDPILEALTCRVRSIELSPPQIPYVSNVTGTWITPSEATDPAYWARHLRAPVCFASGLQCLFDEYDALVLLEVGPGQTLSSLARRHPDKAAGHAVLASLRHPDDPQSDVAFLLSTLGKLWLAGVRIDWRGVSARERRCRLRLPTYPFERKRYWIEPPVKRSSSSAERIRISMEEERSYIEKLEIETAAAASIEKLPDGLERRADELCSSLIYHMLKEQGVGLDVGAKHTRRGLSSKLNVLPKFEKFFGFLVDVLVEDGIAEERGGMIEIVKDARDIKAPRLLMDELCASFPDFAEEIHLLSHCVASYPRALSVEMEAVSVLHPGGGSDLLAPVVKNFERFSNVRACETMIKEILPRVLTRSSGRVRMLEVGGGSGHLTWQLAPYLERYNAEYCFTDIGKYFVMNAEREALARGVKGMRFGVLDISRDPIAQGYPKSGFDVLLAFNVVHATRSLTEAIDNLDALLAPSGVMFLLEASGVARRHTMIWGLEEGWWHFADDGLRTRSPLLPALQWERLLRRQTFASVRVYPQTAERRAAADHALIVVQKRSAAALLRSGVASERRPGAPSLRQRTEAALYSLHARPALANAYVTPSSELELRIAGVWRHVLGIEQVGVHDNFFELGGDSLLAVQLLSKLREALGAPLPPHSLLRASTVASLAELVTGAPARGPASGKAARPALPPSIVELRSGGRRPPLFLVHPAGGHVYFYRDLVQCLEPDQPVYGIEARGVDGKAEPLRQVEDMAAHYVAALRARWPDGPFLLGGASFGGTLAFEMASQLSALGKQAGMVAIIDAGGPGQMPREDLEDDDVMILAYLLGVGADTVVSPDDLRKLEPDERLRFFLERGRRSIRLPLDYGLEQLLPFLRIFKLNLRAMRQYAPRPYMGHVVFFRARERDPINPQNPELAWTGVARGGLTVHEVPGNHITMNFLPNVHVIAGLLKTYIDNVGLPERSSRRFVDSRGAVDSSRAP